MAEQHRGHNEMVLGMLEIGDLVEFDRGKINHWGVYVGGEDIIHLSVDNRSGTGSKKGCVTKDNFWSVAGQSKVTKNNDKDNDAGPLCRVEIKARALSKLGPSDYCITTCNCEHFANWCRYGKQESAQADAGIFFGAVTGVLGMIGGVLLGVMGFLGSAATSSSKRK